MAMAPAFDATRDEYTRLWGSMVVAPAHAGSLQLIANRLLADKPRYRAVSQTNGVPWWIIAIIDQMEAGGGCKRHLHNGDSLQARTRNVPSGRPPPPSRPPFSWEDSALDALHYDGLDRVTDWQVFPARFCYELEKYNGWGYRNKGINTPYLWSYSNHYVSGKFVRDGVYDRNAVSQQPGAMPILHTLFRLDPAITPMVPSAAPPGPPDVEPVDTNAPLGSSIPSPAEAVSGLITSITGWFKRG